jgi:hypothetical protein
MITQMLACYILIILLVNVLVLHPVPVDNSPEPREARKRDYWHCYNRNTLYLPFADEDYTQVTLSFFSLFIEMILDSVSVATTSEF